MTYSQQAAIQKKINLKIEQLAKGLADDGRKHLEDLASYYVEGFRHSYSEFFPIISKISNSNDRNVSLDYLITNLQEMKQILMANEGDFEDSKMFLNKLFDHLNLEISKYNYITVNDDKTVRKFASEIERIQKDATQKFENATLKMETDFARKLQTQTITVLSIFSAIVIAFTGGVALLSGAFESIASSPMIKVLILILTCGGLLYNCIFMLLYYVSKITRQSLYSYCNKANKFCDGQCNEKCNLLQRTFRKIPLLMIVNCAIIVAIFVCVLYQWLVAHGCIIPLFSK